MFTSRQTLLAIALIGCTVLSGCATIVHGGPRSVSVASTPAGAKVSIYDRSNTLVQTNTTPFVAQLSTGYKYFRGQEYRLVFELPAYAPAEVHLQSTISGWYLGNLLFGGVVGMLIVDPITGAMYNLTPEKIEQPLSRTQAQVISKGDGLLVVLASQITPQERAEMVRIN